MNTDGAGIGICALNTEIEPVREAINQSVIALAMKIDGVIAAGLNILVGAGYAMLAAHRGQVTSTMYRYCDPKRVETTYFFLGEAFLVIHDVPLTFGIATMRYEMHVGFRYCYTGRCSHLNRA